MMNMYQVRVTQSTERYDLREKNKKQYYIFTQIYFH